MRFSAALSLLTLTAMAPVAGAQTASSPPAAPRTEVLVLGTYHMANPGHDLFNAQSDDVLAPARQKELAELCAVLAKFCAIGVSLDLLI